jgi:hypothetical protein
VEWNSKVLTPQEQFTSKEKQERRVVNTREYLAAPEVTAEEITSR